MPPIPESLNYKVENSVLPILRTVKHYLSNPYSKWQLTPEDNYIKEGLYSKHIL